MDFLILLLITGFIIGIIWIFDKYNPKIDIVESGNNLIVFLWYNSDNSLLNKRKYIKLFKI